MSTPDAPAPGSIWRHYNGRSFTVLAVAPGYAGRPPAVIFKKYDDYDYLPLDDWHKDMTFVSGPKLPEPPPTAAGCIVACAIFVVGLLAGILLMQ